MGTLRLGGTIGRPNRRPRLVLPALLLAVQLTINPSLAQLTPMPQQDEGLRYVTETYPATLRAKPDTEETIELDHLIAEAMRNNPEILMFQARTSVQQHRVPQAQSLPDPMFMFGYQNEGFKKITLGESDDAMGMFSLSQMFPFWGKRGLKGDMALREAEGASAVAESTQLKVASKVIDTYYDLFLVYKTIDILHARADLFSRIEDAAAGRYAAGMGPQQEVVMAQTEKYMLLEREEMQRQRLQALQGMLNASLGRDIVSPLGRPRERAITPSTVTFDEALAAARSHSPELRAKEKMVQAGEARVKMAKKEYYPDVTLTGSYFPRTKGMEDMWNATAAINLPIFFRSKQRHGVLEAEAGLSEARRDWKATDYMIASNIRDNLSMVTTADRLMKLYAEALIPKINQDVQLALTGYVTGKMEAITVITRLTGLLDTELLYWTQYAERQKAIGKLHAAMGSLSEVRPKTDRDNTEGKGRLGPSKAQEDGSS